MQTYLQFSWLMFDLLVRGFSLSFVAGRHQIYLANFQGKLVEKQNLRCCCDLLKKKIHVFTLAAPQRRVDFGHWPNKMSNETHT